MITLVPGFVSLAQLAALYWRGGKARLDPATEPAIQRAAERIAAIAGSTQAVYGVNTGFGKLASIRINANDLAAASALVSSGALIAAVATGILPELEV